MLLDEWGFGGGINGLSGIVARLQANTYLKLLICYLILSLILETQAFPFVGGEGGRVVEGLLHPNLFRRGSRLLNLHT